MALWHRTYTRHTVTILAVLVLPAACSRVGHPSSITAPETRPRLAVTPTSPDTPTVEAASLARDPAEIGAWDPGWDAWDVAVVGRYAYVAGGTGGLSVVDIQDPSDPHEVGAYRLPGRAATGEGAVVSDGRYAYLALGKDGLWILDVSDPTNPRAVFTLVGTDLPASRLALADDLLLVGAGDSGLRIVDVGVPTSPVQIGRYNASSRVADVAVAGQRVYLALGGAGLRVVDVSDPGAPVEIASFDPGWSVDRVRVAGRLAYVIDTPFGSPLPQRGGMHVMDIASADTPREIGQYTGLGSERGQVVDESEEVIADDEWGAVDLDVDGSYAYFVVRTDRGHALQVVDVGDPTHPRLVSTLPHPWRSLDDNVNIRVIDGHVYIAGSRAGLRVIRVADPAAPTEVGAVDTPDLIWDVAVDGHLAYAVASEYGLRIVDISDPSAPVEIGSLHPGWYGWTVDVADGYAYVGTSEDGLRIVDVRDPTRPNEVASFGLPPVDTGVNELTSRIDDEQIVGDLAYLATSFDTMVILDISNPAVPVQVGNFNTDSDGGAVHVVGRYGYVVEWSGGLVVVDVTDPTAPREVGRYDPPAFHATFDVNSPHVANDVYVADGYAYVAGMADGLHIVDVRDPAHPVLAARFIPPPQYGRPGQVLSVTVSNRYALVAADWGGLLVLDVHDPAHPVQRRAIDIHCATRQVVTQGDRAYIAATCSGIRIVDLAAAIGAER